MYLLFGLLPIFPLFGMFFNKKRYDIYYLFLFILLLVLTTFRNLEVGTDTLNYYYQYLKIKGNHPINIEPLWYFLNQVVIHLGGSFQHVLLLADLLILCPIFWIAKYKTPNKYQALFFYLSLYLFFYSLNITRQCVAMSFVLLGMCNLFEQKNFKFFIWILLASLFHFSALVCLPLIFISKITIKLKYHIILVVFCMILGLFFHHKLLGFFISSIYSNYSAFNLEFGNFFGNLLFLIILNSFYFFVYWVSKDKGILFKLFFFYILMMNIFIRIPFGMRVVLYFSMVQLLFYPLLISNNKFANRNVVLLVLIGFALCIFVMNFGNGKIFPYTFFKYD